jgi:hypothetical protein
VRFRHGSAFGSVGRGHGADKGDRGTFEGVIAQAVQRGGKRAGRATAMTAGERESYRCSFAIFEEIVTDPTSVSVFSGLPALRQNMVAILAEIDRELDLAADRFAREGEFADVARIISLAGNLAILRQRL